jgi:hypothetical protein
MTWLESRSAFWGMNFSEEVNMINETIGRRIAERNTNCRNADNHDLLLRDELPIAAVWEVVGAGGEEIREFVPTRYELLELAKLWASLAIRRSFVVWANAVGGNHGANIDWRQICFAWRRLERIRNLVGEEAVDDLIGEQLGELYESHGCRSESLDWEDFLRHVDRDGQKEWIATLNIRAEQKL